MVPRFPGTNREVGQGVRRWSSRRWGGRVVVVLTATIVGTLGLAGRCLVPKWWAHQVEVVRSAEEPPRWWPDSWKQGLEDARWVEGDVLAAADDLCSVDECVEKAQKGGNPSVFVLQALLHHSDEHVRQTAAEVLWRMAPHAARAFKAPQPYARGPSASGSFHSIADELATHGRLQPTLLVQELTSDVGTDGAIARLVRLLRHEDPRVRYRAAKVLAWMGREGVPTLVCGLTDTDARTRVGAARALCFMGLDATSAAPDLVKALRDKAPGVRCWAAKALCIAGRSYEGAVPALNAALKDPDFAVRAEASSSLFWLGH